MPPGDGQVECPRNKTYWDKRAQIVCNGSMTQRGLIYHCLPTDNLNTTEERCLAAINIQKGSPFSIDNSLPSVSNCCMNIM